MTEDAYTVVDTRTDKTVFSVNSSVRAYAFADARDQRYGRVCTRVVRNYDVMSDEEFASFMRQAA